MFLKRMRRCFSCVFDFIQSPFFANLFDFDLSVDRPPVPSPPFLRNRCQVTHVSLPSWRRSLWSFCLSELATSTWAEMIEHGLQIIEGLALDTYYMIMDWKDNANNVTNRQECFILWWFLSFRRNRHHPLGLLASALFCTSLVWGDLNDYTMTSDKL